MNKAAKKPGITISALHKQVKALKNRLRNILVHQSNVNTELRASLKKHDSRLKHVSPHEIEKKLDVLEVRLDLVNRAYGLLIEKTTVLTEIVFWNRMGRPEELDACAAACVWAFDAMPDDWWRERLHMNVGQWHTEIMQVWADYLEICAENKQMRQKPYLAGGMKATQ